MAGQHQNRPSNKPSPRLPEGNASILQGITENFAFHASPESFITSRAIKLSQQQPELIQKRTIVRAKILNRNVAIVSAYDHIRQVLSGANTVDSQPVSDRERLKQGQSGDAEVGTEEDNTSPKFVAASAYDELMSDFFPGPNLLLSDGCPHREMRSWWDDKMASCYAQTWKSQIKEVVNQCYSDDFVMQGKASVSSPPETAPATFDLYEAMKRFSWRLLLKCFLSLEPDNGLFAEVQAQQETLLRGQFSLLPISLNTGFWKSPRKRGIEARRKLQDLIAQRLRQMDGTSKGSPFGVVENEAVSHVLNHVLMMTSSLAVKGMASLFTAFILNVFCFKQNNVLLCDQIRQIQDPALRRELLRSTYLETERLSPPIVGIMRRSAAENIIQLSDAGEADILLPTGWDVWLYFVGGGRDPNMFGEQSDLFVPERYLDHQTPEPLGFGMGSKACLGKELVREAALAFVEYCLARHCQIQYDSLRPGVKGWLGWMVASPEQWASDMKQLPTQHPSEPILVKIVEMV